MNIVPPRARSKTSLRLTVNAMQGRFALQRCRACGAVQYPPAEVCRVCLGIDLPWQDVDPTGTLLAATRTHVSNEPYFHDRSPWWTGIVRLESGPSIIAHLSEGCLVDEGATLSMRLDAAGRGVIVASPAGPEADPRPEFSTRSGGVTSLRTADADGAAYAVMEALDAHHFAWTASQNGLATTIDVDLPETRTRVIVTAEPGPDA